MTNLKVNRPSQRSSILLFPRLCVTLRFTPPPPTGYNFGMSEERKKPGIAFRTAVVVVMLVVAYPLSFGPACWIASRNQPSGDHVSAAYRPIFWFWANCADSWAGSILAHYVGMAAKGNVFGVSRNPARIEFN
jgi:hypothetical protein